jgi:formylglycine-generating enzyme required for sulfatase activity
LKGASLPIESVSWNDAQEFCKKVSAKTGQTVRLPTEAEWEYACRAGTTTAYYSGDTEADLGRAAWYGANINGSTHPVGQKEPNAWGLYDMHGNVWEWCQDYWYEEYEAGAATDPQGPDTGTSRVLRGGFWLANPWFCRSAFRSVWAPGRRDGSFGFRVVLAGPP